MNFQYVVALFVLAALYVVALLLVKRARSSQLLNLTFVLLVFLPYICLCAIVYADVGFDDWNFQNLLPTANVSPFMFVMTPLVFVLPRKARGYLLLLISLLSVGMLLSVVFGCLFNAWRSYAFHHHFLLDYVSHLSLSLFGVYLVRSGQVELKPRSALLSGGLIYGVAFVMMILNLIFDTSFFGLSLTGKHNIYNVVLTESSWLSALLYLLGLGAVLAMGYVFCKVIKEARPTAIGGDTEL